MKMDFHGDRLLAVVAHPDDAELLCAGTLARARRDGAAVGICVLCRGDKGQPAPPIPDLAAVRRKEMAASAALLGAKWFPGTCPDGNLLDSSPNRLKLVEIFRTFKPSLVLAHAPEDYHPDHQAASSLAEAVSWLSASPGFKTRRPALGHPPAIWWMDTLQMNRFVPGLYIDISEFLELRVRMLACHRSQLQRANDPGFSPLADLMRTQARVRGMQACVAAAEAFRAHDAWKRSRAW